MPKPAPEPAAARPAWLTARERVTLAILGGTALAGLSLSWWLRRPQPIQLVVGPEPAAAWDAALEHARQLDVNRATAQELERLPEVGPSMAERIVAWRAAHGAFTAIEQLQDVPGIGPKTFEQLREYVTIR
jgi:competence protein ComEA